MTTADHRPLRGRRRADRGDLCVRDAANRDDFFGPATEILGAAPELISGSEEAQLSFNGATRDLPPIDGRSLVVDIGGGSTEFALGTDQLESSLSVDMGCVRMTEKFLHHDPPLPEELSNALSVVDSTSTTSHVRCPVPATSTASSDWPARSPRSPRWSSG